MPLARYALYAQDIEIYVAPTWDTGESWLASMRHIAKEAGCWVIGTATALQGSDIPADFPERDRLFTPDEWINDGDAVVVKPRARSLRVRSSARRASCMPRSTREAARRARRSLDVCGHYARPDIFSLSVNRRPLKPAVFVDGPTEIVGQR